MALPNTLTNGRTSAIWYFPKDVCNGFCLSHQTIEGLRITGILNLSSNTGNICQRNSSGLTWKLGK